MVRARTILVLVLGALVSAALSDSALADRLSTWFNRQTTRAGLT
jgi:hypothetical protein